MRAVINAIHVTHEAVHKVGGIGTVLEGLINSRPYRDDVGRTILVCPLFYPEDDVRLGPTGDIEYSPLDRIRTGPCANALELIEREFGVHIVYGQRMLIDEASARQIRCEVLLIDLRGANPGPINTLKGRLWDYYGLPSDWYEHIWEYEQYVELAPAAIAALEVLQLATPDAPAVIFAHEFMGVPLALAAQCMYPHRYRTLYYAHEVAPVRRIIERHPGHDVMFYNALTAARKDDLYLEQVFGSQQDYHKHAVVEAARFCDGLLAVGPRVRDELHFMGPDFDGADVGLAYNGVPFSQITLKQRHASRERIRNYCETLLGRRPELIFTHVTRLAPSKAMWRDFDVLAALDSQLGQRNQTAVMLVLATELPRRPEEDILRMEREWNWPLTHRVGEPDLTGGEALYHEYVQAFNARAQNITVIFINQFGFDRQTLRPARPARCRVPGYPASKRCRVRSQPVRAVRDIPPGAADLRGHMPG